MTPRFDPSRRTFLTGAIAGGTALALGGTMGSCVQPSKRVLGPADVTYRGAFRLPGVDGDDASWGSGVTHRRVGGELRFIATALHETTYEVRYPGTATTSPYPTAELVHVWGDIWRRNCS